MNLCGVKVRRRRQQIQERQSALAVIYNEFDEFVKQD